MTTTELTPEQLAEIEKGAAVSRAVTAIEKAISLLENELSAKEVINAIVSMVEMKQTKDR